MTEPKNVSAAAVAAANWWAKAVGAPRFDNGGDPIAGMLASMLSAQHPVSGGDQATFAGLLADAIDADLTRMVGVIDDPYTTLGVDYGPDRILADAAKASGIAVSRFPWKTVMWVYPEKVTVSAGYGAPTVLVWASDEWLSSRPACGQQQYNEGKYGTQENYGGEPWKCSAPVYHDGPHVYDEPLALCSRCGHPEGFWHSEERAYRADHHAFVAAAAVSS